MITIEDLKKKQSETSRLIGLDLGSKRIGVSICDEKQSIATPFKTINKTNTNELIEELKKLINEYDIKGIIIGNPINMDGSLGRSAQSVNDVSNNIDKAIDVDVCLWDERLSTVEFRRAEFWQKYYCCHRSWLQLFMIIISRNIGTIDLGVMIICRIAFEIACLK